jgi:hypothetical protein
MRATDKPVTLCGHVHVPQLYTGDDKTALQSAACRR